MAAAATDEDVLEIVAQAARDVIGARHGVARHRVHLSVLDDGPGFELPQRPVGAPAGPGGWGLYLVDRYAVRWGANVENATACGSNWSVRMPPETGYTAEPLSPGTTAVAVAGEVTFSNVVDFDRALGEALDAGAQNLVVDLTDVTFIDSSGLSSLLTASARARDDGGVVALVLTQGEPPSIFRFRGVDRLLSLYPSREAALEGVSR